MMTENMSEDDQWSPECLMTSKPVRDPYSTDEELGRGKKNTIMRDLKRKFMEEPSTSMSKQQQYFLSSNISATDICPESVLFYTNLDFIKMESFKNLQDFTVCDIVKTCFQFMSNVSDDKEITHWNNKSIKDICNNTMDTFKFLKWLKENDTLDYKTGQHEAIKEMNRMQEEELEKYIDKDSQVKPIIDLLQMIQSASNNGFQHHDNVKRIFGEFGNLLNKRIAHSGEAIHKCVLYIPEAKASDHSNLFQSRMATITSKPDLTYLVANNKRQKISRCVVEVFTPPPDHIERKYTTNCVVKVAEFYNCGGPSTQAHPHAKKRQCSWDSKLDKPIAQQNDLLNDVYREHARAYIRKSIPSHFHENTAFNKIAGKHIVQLLCLAYIMEKLVYQEIYTVLGFFVLNEYVYLTRLDIDRAELLTLSNPLAECRLFAGSGDWVNEGSGKLRFSNFRLDLTKYKDRMSLFIFLHEYFKDESFQHCN